MIDKIYSFGSSYREPEAVRTAVGNAHVYEVFINSRETNLAVMLLGNEANFSWLTERSGEFVPVFEFLADEDAATEKTSRIYLRKTKRESDILP